MYLDNRMLCEVPAGSLPPGKAFAARVRTDFRTYTATAIRGRADVMQPNVAPSSLVHERPSFFGELESCKDEPTALADGFMTSPPS